MAHKRIIVMGSYIEALVMDVPRLPLKGETLMGSNFRQTWGGKGSNQAVQAARLGMQTSFATMIGQDSFGDNFLKMMETEKVDSTFVFRHPNLPTASGFIICTPDGHNVITIDIGALNALGKAEADRALAGADAQTVVLLQLEIPTETALYACRRAKQNGATVILNPAPAADLSHADLSCIDFLTPNETEARICAGLPPDDPRREEEIGQMLLKKGCQHVIVTLGEKGSLLISDGETRLVSPFPIPQVVDSTGAGDAFNAGFAAALAEGFPTIQAMLFGNATGALACTRPDTIPSFHARREVETFMRLAAE